MVGAGWIRGVHRPHFVEFEASLSKWLARLGEGFQLKGPKCTERAKKDVQRATQMLREPPAVAPMTQNNIAEPRGFPIGTYRVLRRS